MRTIKKLFIFIVLFSITNVYAFEKCEMSDAYRDYLNLSDEEKDKTIAPTYCKGIENMSERTISYRATTSSTSYNAKNEGLITSVKNQGLEGTCWAFSGMGAVEANAKKNGLQTYDFSESHMVYSVMAGAYSDSAGKTGKYNSEVSNGGKIMYPASYFFSGAGQLNESEWTYPTTTHLPTITSSNYKKGRKLVTVSNFSYDHVSASNSACTSSEITNIKAKILNNASVVGTVYMHGNNFADSGMNYYLAKSSSSVNAYNHGILIVGWDDNISKTKFKNATRNGAWIVKNSYGSSWSDDGYFYISYDDHFICKNIATYGGVSNSTYGYTYQSSEVVGDLGLLYKGKTYLSTRFDKQSNSNEQLKRVSFAVGKNVPYKVYISPTNTLTSKVDWIQIASGTPSTYGIESVNLTDQMLIPNSFTVIVEHNVPTSGVPIFTTCDFIEDATTIPYEFNKSYYSTNMNSWYDMAAIIMGGSVSQCEPNIYAYTNSIDTYSTVNPTAINIDKSEVRLTVNSTENLVTTFSPSNVTYKTLTWYSNNPSIAKVDSKGKVTAVNVGNTTITAETANGKKDTINVIVTNTAVPVTNISLNQSSVSISEGTIAKFSPTTSPNDATNAGVLWSSNDTKVAKIDIYGNVMGLNNGTTTITAKTRNGVTTTATVKVSGTYNLTFNDVPKDSWYYSCIKEAYLRKIISGYSTSRFSPHDKVTRGQLVTILFGIEGQPNVSTTTLNFKDVAEGKYYTNGVKWASLNGIISGYGNTNKFGPGDPILRKDLAVILYGYAKYKGLNTSTNSSYLTSFADYNSSIRGGYAEEALSWAVKNNIITGMTSSNGSKIINPNNKTTRAEASAMITNMIHTFKIQ